MPPRASARHGDRLGLAGRGGAIEAATNLRAETTPSPFQAADAAGASSSASRGASSRRTESEQPGISSAVRNCPTQARATSRPRARSTAMARRATIASSMVGVPPRLLTSKATWPGARRRDRPGSHRSSGRPGHRPARPARGGHRVRRGFPGPARPPPHPAKSRPAGRGDRTGRKRDPHRLTAAAASRATAATSARLAPPRPRRRRLCGPGSCRRGRDAACAARRRPVRRRRPRPPFRPECPRLGPLGGQAEVQPIAGVVLDDQESPCGPATARIAAKTASAWRCEHIPATAASSIPRPM